MVLSLKALTTNYCIIHPEETLLDTADAGSNQTGLTAADGKLKRGTERSKLSRFRLKRNAFLPAHLCEPLLQEILKARPENLCYLRIFADRSRCQLTKVDLSYVYLVDHSYLTDLFDHSIEELDLSNATLKLETVQSIKKLQSSLIRLNLSHTLSNPSTYEGAFLETLQKLIKLDVSSTGWVTEKSLKYISKLKRLQWLDLSNSKLADVNEIAHLSSSLEHLYLYNSCQSLKCRIQFGYVLSNLLALTHLDISRELTHIEGGINLLPSREENYLHTDLLATIGKLPNLIHLDISGCTGLVNTDIDVFRDASRKRLYFFGLFKTSLEFHRDLPAQVISGSANEEQILVALSVYLKRPSYIMHCLQILFDKIHHEGTNSPERVLKLTLAASKALLNSEHVQLAASACIFSLLRHDHARQYSSELRKSTISAILDIMENHKSRRIQMNCCQCLCNCNIPEEVDVESFRMCKLLLQLLKSFKDTNLRLVALILVNAVVCYTPEMKLKAGNLEAVQIILGVIEERLSAVMVDRLLETCWSALWNMTDETPENCQSFVYYDGMELFMQCFQEFEDETELQRCMMGLMGNIAEVQSIRPSMMKKSFVRKFLELLDHTKYDFEINYNAAGVLSHLCSDGEEAWTLKPISRDQCMQAVIVAVGYWNIDANRNINYRSLNPILRLIPCSDTPCAQLWSIWALANLTRVYPNKYCKLLASEGGVEVLEKFVNSPDHDDDMKKFARMTLDTLRTNLGLELMDTE